MNKINRKPAQTVAELASARQHQKNWPTIMERAVEGATSSDEEQEVPASQSPSKPQTTAKERNAAAKAMILRKAAKIVLFIINGLFETYR